MIGDPRTVIYRVRYGLIFFYYIYIGQRVYFLDGKECISRSFWDRRRSGSKPPVCNVYFAGNTNIIDAPLMIFVKGLPKYGRLKVVPLRAALGKWECEIVMVRLFLSDVLQNLDDDEKDICYNEFGLALCVIH